MGADTPGSSKFFLPTLKKRKPVHPRAKLFEHRPSNADIWPPIEQPVQLPKFRDPHASLFAEKKFRSTKTYVEQKLREALELTGDSKDVLPNVSLTHTACHCLQMLSREQDLPFANVLANICDLIFPALYLDKNPGAKGCVPFEMQTLYFMEFRQAVASNAALKQEAKDRISDLQHQNMVLQEEVKQMNRALESAQLSCSIKEQDIRYESFEKEKLVHDLGISRKDQTQAEKEAMKFRTEADCIPDMRLQVEMLQMREEDLKEKLETLSKVLENTNTDCYKLQRQVDRMVPKPHFLTLEEEFKASEEKVEALLGDWELLWAELEDAKQEVTTLRALSLRLTPRMDPEQEVISKQLLRQNNSRVPHDARSGDLPAIFCEAIQKLSDTCNQLRVTKGASSTSGGATKGAKRKISEVAPAERFEVLGDNPQIPEYLRAQVAVTNARFTPTEARAIVSEVWELKYKSSGSLQNSLLQSLKQRASGLDLPVPSVGYSFFAALAASEDPECGIFRDIYHGRLSESVHRHMYQQIQGLQEKVLEWDKAANGAFTPSGEIGLAGMSECLQVAFPVKPPENLRAVEALWKTLMGKRPALDYKGMLSPTSEVGMLLQLQYQDEREDFQAELTGVVENADTAHVGLLSFGTFCAAVNKIDPDKTEAEARQMCQSACKGEIVDLIALQQVFQKEIIVRTTRCPSTELRIMLDDARSCLRKRTDTEGCPLFSPELVDQIFHRYSSVGKTVTAIDEKCIRFALCELNLMFGQEYATYQLGLNSLGYRVLKKGRAAPLRVSINQLREASIGQACLLMEKKLEGSEWACRSFNEDAGGVAYDNVLPLIQAMDLASTENRLGQFKDWVRIVNRKLDVKVGQVLEQWLNIEDECIRQESERIERLLRELRTITGGHEHNKKKHRLLSRNECSTMTKQFNPDINLEQLSTVLGEIPDPCDYLSLMEAWLTSKGSQALNFVNFTA